GAAEPDMAKHLLAGVTARCRAGRRGGPGQPRQGDRVERMARRRVDGDAVAMAEPVHLAEGPGPFRLDLGRALVVVVLEQRLGEALAALGEPLPDLAPGAVVEAAPGGDLVDRAQAAFAPAARRVEPADVGAGARHRRRRLARARRAAVGVAVAGHAAPSPSP